MNIETNLFQNINKYGSIEPEDINEVEQTEVFTITHEEWLAIQTRMDKEIMDACNTRIWINPDRYQPTEREIPYIIGVVE